MKLRNRLFNMKYILFSFLFILIIHSNLLAGIKKAELSSNILKTKKVSKDIRVYWIGHATVLLRLYNKWIITDPVFSKYIGLIMKRKVDPGINPDELPVMNWVLISHTHLDHLDKASLLKLKSPEKILVPDGGIAYIPDKLSDRVIGINTWKVIEDDGVRITAVPAKHFGGRYLIDNLWDGDPYTGYIIEYKDLTVFFAGDTAYDPGIFKQLGKKYDIDIALIPIGPSGGFQLFRFFSRYVHVDPFEAVQLFQDIRAKWMIPIHYGTFYRSGEGARALLNEAMDKHHVHDNIILLNIGDAAYFNMKANKHIIVESPVFQCAAEPVPIAKHPDVK